MQALLGGPRSGLTDAQVWSLLRDYPAPHYDRGLEVLDSSLTVVRDVSDWLQAGTVSHDFTKTDGPHRTCNLVCRAGFAFDSGAQFLRPFMMISDGQVTGRFDLGVFRAGRPQSDWSTSPGTVTIPGSDLLVFLARPIGRAYTIAAGAGYGAAAGQLWADAGMPSRLELDTTNAGKTLDAAKTWDVDNDNTWLAAFNWLMAGMGYAPVSVDETGAGQARPYVPATSRDPEAVWDFDDLLRSIVAADRQDTTDQGAGQIANVWIFQNQNVDSPTEGAGQYTVRNQSSGPTSISGQGGWEWPTVVAVDVPDQDALVAAGDAQVDAALTAARLFTLHTRPFPIAGHGDVIAYSDLAVLGGKRTVQEQSWVLDLGNSTTPPADVEWVAGTVVGWLNSAAA